MADPTSRMLKLLSLLQTHRHWGGAELAGRLEVSERTLRRDVDRLRGLGYPVDATRGTDGGYQLAAGSQLPPLLLDDEEAVAIAVGLRATAVSPVAGIDETSVRALAKLEQVLPARLRHRVGALQHFTESARPFQDGATIDPSDLTEIAGACRDAVRLRFDYERRDGVFGGRMVEPHRLVSTGRRWYLVAWDVDRGDWRTFRVDRMVEPKALTRTFEPRVLPDGVDAAAFVEAGLQSAWAPAEAVLTLAAPLDEVAGWSPMAGMSLETVDADHCRLHLRADNFTWLAVNVALLPFPVVDLAPADLADEVRRMADRLTAAAAP
jgi:predicted DNA-binding transcriptional regulator YafY